MRYGGSSCEVVVVSELWCVRGLPRPGEKGAFVKLQAEEGRKINTIPSEMDEDNRSVLLLLPCSSSDLERVAGTRLWTVESVVILWASVD